MRDQEKSKDFYVRILGGNVIKPENPCYNKLANTWIILNSVVARLPTSQRFSSRPLRILTGVNSFLNLRVAKLSTCYKQWGQRSVLSYRAGGQSRLGMALLHG